MEEATQNQALLGPPILEEEVGAVTSGEYCEIESPGIPTDVGEEIKDEQIYTVTNTTRSPQGGGGGGIQSKRLYKQYSGENLSNLGQNNVS